MTTFADGLQETNSRKLVFTRLTHRKELFDWTLSGSVYYGPMIDPMRLVGVNEDDVEATETASLSALNALDTSTVGGWWYDWENELVYVKPKSGTTAFDHLWIGSVELRLSRDGDELDDEVFDGRVSDVPSLTLRTNEVFDGKVAEIGAGNIRIANTSEDGLNFYMSLGIEPDGLAQVVEQLEIFG
jgi:hypothetical protein